MATLLIRNIDEEVKTELRLLAARHGHSMEEEARSILRLATSQERVQRPGIGTRIHERFKKIGGVDLELPPRHAKPRFPDLRS